MRRLRSISGQYMPIALMVMFTIVVSISAVVNYYVYARAKLKLQNLAEAVALHMAAREARLLNTITTINDWGNHLYVPGDQWINHWNAHKNQGLPPPISFAEGYTFNSYQGATAYAKFMASLNQRAKLGQDIHSTFLGLPTATPGLNSATANWFDRLKAEIPDVDPAVNPGLFMRITNQKSNLATIQQQMQQHSTNPSAPNGGSTTPPNFMASMNFKVLPINVSAPIPNPNPGGPDVLVTKSLADWATYSGVPGPQLPSTNAIGYYGLDPNASQPTVDGTPTGTGIIVVMQENIRLPIGASVPVAVTVRAMVVSDRAKLGLPNSTLISPTNGQPAPEFKGTYWAKLVPYP